MSSEKQIDIVIPWVDGNDSQWRDRYMQYRSTINDGDKSDIRFRDWDLLKYWFRGIEKFAPWVRKIHFVTSGELPEWLDLENPRLNWVKHEDFIPQAYLPTFSINAIELNFHRIEGLSDRFIYFNDDMFLIKASKETDFFKRGLPCDFGVMSAKPAMGGIIHMAINDLDILERRFDKRIVMRKNFSKWFSPKYGIKVMNNILLYPWKEFSGFIDPHIAQPFLKKSFEAIWDFAADKLDATCRKKFRTNDDVNQWVVRYWQLAEGLFYPKNTMKTSICIDITEENLASIKDVIVNQKCQSVCFNDSKAIGPFEEVRKSIESYFAEILPQKSAFEKEV